MSASKSTGNSVLSRLLRSRVWRALLIVHTCVALVACDAWVSADTRVARARTQLDEGKYQAAMVELKTTLEREPDHTQARVLLAELSMWLGDLDSAEKEIDRALAAGASEDEVRHVRYEVLLARQRFDEMHELLEKDRTTSPVRRLVLEARMQGGRGQYPEAEETLSAALTSAPDDPEALLEMARVAAARGEHRRALELPDRIGQSGATYARALLLRGTVLVSRGEHQRARDALLQAQESGRKHLRVPEQLAMATALTEAHLALGDIDAADRSVAVLTSWAPEFVITHYLRARIAMLKNDPVAAVAECQKALRANPEHVPSQILLAAAHLSQRSFEQAEDTLTRMLASNPENLAARKLLAQVYLGRNQPDQAQRLLATASQSTEADAQVDWLMGVALLQAGNNTSGLSHLERSVAAAPDDVQRRIDLAGAYLIARKPDQAIPLLKSVPADSPVAARAQVLLVLATVAGKPRAEASRGIDALVAQHGEDVGLLSVAGAYLGENGETGRARTLLERAIRLDPKAVSARMALARLAAVTRDIAGAEQQLGEILKVDPAHQAARLGLSELAWSKGDRTAARKWLEEAISADPAVVDARLRLAQIAFVEGDAARGRALLDQAVNVAGDRKAVLNRAGTVLARTGFTDEALAKFQQAAADGLPEGIISAARLHLELDRHEQARDLVESALADKPDWAEAQRLLIEIDARDGQVERALARARSMNKNAPPAALRSLEGDIYAFAGQYPAAIAAYEDAQRQHATAAVAIGIFRLRRISTTSPAERSLQQWLQKSPADVEVRRVLAAYYDSSGRRKEAIGEYERLLAADSIDPLMLNNLAWLLHEQSDPRALHLARRAHEAAPAIAEIADTYGWILVQTDKVTDGIRVLERALAGAPTNPDIQYHAATAYARSGQSARAVELLRESLKSDQKFASREDAARLLELATSEGS